MAFLGVRSRNSEQDARLAINTEFALWLANSDSLSCFSELYRHLRNEIGPDFGPSLRRIHECVVAFWCISDQPVGVPQTSEMFDVCVNARKSACVLNDCWTQAPLLVK